MEEIWKDIDGYEGYYQVSNLGRVRSLDRYIKNGDGLQFRNGHIKKQWKNPDGYYCVKLSKDNVDRNIATHIIVAQAFINNLNYSDGWEVNHKDFNRTNNISDNLEWTTRQENVAYTTKAGRMSRRYGEDNPNYHNDTLKKKYEEHPELTMCCSRPGKKNGRSIPIIMTNLSNNAVMKFDYIRQCSQYLINNSLVKNKHVDGLSTIIKKHIEDNKPYKGFAFSLQ